MFLIFKKEIFDKILGIEGEDIVCSKFFCIYLLKIELERWIRG